MCPLPPPTACRHLNPTGVIRLKQVTAAVEITYEMSGPLAPTELTLWRSLVDEISDLVGEPALTSVVVTDDMPGVVSGLHTSIPWQFGARDDDTPYNPEKVDGGLAVGRTIPLEDRTVIVVNAGTARIEPGMARRLLHHEARHARLHHGGDTAWAMHRRGPFERPPGYVFAYVYLAQSMLDEYRCEAALAPDVTASTNLGSVRPSDWADVAQVFDAARQHYAAEGDLSGAYSIFLSGLDRVSSFAGHAAATVSRGELSVADWADVAPVVLAVEALADVPSADERLTHPELSDIVERLIHTFGYITEALGFQVDVDEEADTTSFWLL